MEQLILLALDPEFKKNLVLTLFIVIPALIIAIPFIFFVDRMEKNAKKRGEMIDKYLAKQRNTGANDSS